MNFKEAFLTVEAAVGMAAIVGGWLYKLWNDSRKAGIAKGEENKWRDGVDLSLADVRSKAQANETMQRTIERTQAETIQWRAAVDKTLDNFRQNDIEHFEHAADTELHMTSRERDDLTEWRRRQEQKLDLIHTAVLALHHDKK